MEEKAGRGGREGGDEVMSPRRGGMLVGARDDTP